MKRFFPKNVTLVCFWTAFRSKKGRFRATFVGENVLEKNCGSKTESDFQKIPATFSFSTKVVHQESCRYSQT